MPLMHPQRFLNEEDEASLGTYLKRPLRGTAWVACNRQLQAKEHPQIIFAMLIFVPSILTVIWDNLAKLSSGKCCWSCVFFFFLSGGYDLSIQSRLNNCWESLCLQNHIYVKNMLRYSTLLVRVMETSFYCFNLFGLPQTRLEMARGLVEKQFWGTLLIRSVCTPAVSPRLDSYLWPFAACHPHSLSSGFLSHV